MEGWNLGSLTKMVSSVRQMVTGEYTDLEWKVKQLTNSDPWGCSPTDMQSFLDSLHTSEDRHSVLSALQSRLQTAGSWRSRYKSLNLLDHILKHGPNQFLQQIRDQQSTWMVLLADLKEGYEFVDERGKDEGVNVRVKAGSIMELLSDPELLVKTRKEEQEKRELMKKRRQEFQQNSNNLGGTLNNSEHNSMSTGSFSSLSSTEPTKKQEAYQELRSSPALSALRGSPGTDTEVVLPDIQKLAIDDVRDEEDEFDEFQSALDSAAGSPVEAKPVTQDPFEDLLNL